MGISDIFKNSASKKGEHIGDFVISLGGDRDFKELLYSTPKPMSFRLLIDHLLVCLGASTYLLYFKYTGKPNEAKQAFESMIKRHLWHLDSLLKSKTTLNVRDIIVAESEKELFIRDGWKMNESTTIHSIFSVIADYRMDKYSKAVGDGMMEYILSKDSARVTAELMQQSKKNCGEEGFPYVELKLIYTGCISKIFAEINK
ncbi:MAG: hypothetical protein ACYC5X_04770 [Syntrophales bacterium]